MKVCSRCKKSKPTTEFPKDSTRPDGLNHRCRCCESELRSQPKNLERARVRYKLRRRKAKLMAIEMLGGKCESCGGVFPPEVYDFHHPHGVDKVSNVSKLTKGSFDKVKAEIVKCVLLCANCHRIEHAEEL